MSTEQSILTAVKADLAKITTANGYTFDFNTAYNGDLSNAENNQDLKPYYVLGDTRLNGHDESYSFTNEASITLKILVKFNSSAAEGELSNKQENIINDLRRWKVSPTDYNINYISGVQYSVITNIHRQITFSNNMALGECGISINIVYQSDI